MPISQRINKVRHFRLWTWWCCGICQLTCYPLADVKERNIQYHRIMEGIGRCVLYTRHSLWHNQPTTYRVCFNNMKYLTQAGIFSSTTRLRKATAKIPKRSLMTN